MKWPCCGKESNKVSTGKRALRLLERKSRRFLPFCHFPTSKNTANLQIGQGGLQKPAVDCPPKTKPLATEPRSYHERIVELSWDVRFGESGHTIASTRRNEKGEAIYGQNGSVDFR